MVHREIKPCHITKNGKKVWIVRVPKDLRGSEPAKRFFGDNRKAADSFAKQLGHARQSVGAEFMKLTPPEQAAIITALRELGVDELLKAASAWKAKGARMAISVKDVVAQCLDAKEKSGARSNYLKTLKCSLNSFAASDNKNLCDVTVGDVEDWLNSNGWQPKTRLGYLKDVSTLFKYAMKRGIVSANPTDGVERPKLDQKTPQIFTVQELRRYLDTCLDTDPALLGYICPILFGGVRPAESQRTTKDNVRNGVIDLSGPQTKLRKRRVIVINETLKEWLSMPGVQFGNVNLTKRLRRLAKVARVTPTHDVLRHSFCSYALPRFGARVTAEMAAHTEQVLFTNYREIVSDRASKAFWALRPKPLRALARAINPPVRKLDFFEIMTIQAEMSCH